MNPESIHCPCCRKAIRDPERAEIMQVLAEEDRALWGEAPPYYIKPEEKIDRCPRCGHSLRGPENRSIRVYLCLVDAEQFCTICSASLTEPRCKWCGQSNTIPVGEWYIDRREISD